MCCAAAGETGCEDSTDGLHADCAAELALDELAPLAAADCSSCCAGCEGLKAGFVFETVACYIEAARGQGPIDILLLAQKNRRGWRCFVIGVIRIVGQYGSRIRFAVGSIGFCKIVLQPVEFEDLKPCQGVVPDVQ